MRISVNLSFAVLFIAAQADAQYFYKDIVSNRQVLADMAAYKLNNVRSVNINSLDEQGQEIESFFCQKKISKDYRKTELFTRADQSTPSLLISTFDAQGKLLSTNDSSALLVSNIRYSYDTKGRISSIFSRSNSSTDEYQTEITEEHIYSYDETGHPEKMVLVKNGRDSTDILFGQDGKGNTIIEKNSKNGNEFFYYYDARDRLTDVVPQYDENSPLKPNYLFEYNSAGSLSQMTSVEEGSSHYFVWKYSYENGMRIKDRCYSDERRLMGSFEYEYK